MLEKTLSRVPWIASRLNQSIVKNINSVNIHKDLKPKLQYFELQLQRGDSLEKTLDVEKIEGKRRRLPRRGDEMVKIASLTQWT